MNIQPEAVPAFRISNWETIYENNRTREMKRMDWVPVPNRMDGDGYTELLDHSNGAAHLGAWLALLQVASRCKPRGTLSRDGGGPHDATSLSRISRIPVEVFLEVFPRLLTIGWIEPATVREFKQMHDGAEIPQDGAGIPHDAAALPQDGAPRAHAGTERNGSERNGTDGTEAPSPSQLRIMPPAAEFALTADAVRSFFQIADDQFITDLFFKCVQVNRNVTDKQVADAVYACYTTAQRGPGLFMSTVPKYVAAVLQGLNVRARDAPISAQDESTLRIIGNLERMHGKHL